MTNENSKQDMFAPIIVRAIGRLNASDYRRAASLVESALRIRSEPQAWQLLGVTWKKCGEEAKARQALLRAVELDPSSTSAWVNLAAVELKLGLFREAVEHYRRAVANAPSHASLHIWLANAFDLAGILTDALNSYEDAESLEPSNAELFYERALCYRNHGLFKQAERDFKRAYELDPLRESDLEAAQQMAVAPHPASQNFQSNSDRGHTTDDACEPAFLAKTMADYRYNAVLSNNRGRTLWRRGDTDAAVAEFERAVELEPQYLQAWMNLAALLRLLGRVQEEERALRTVVELDPSYTHGYYNLALTLLTSLRFEDALAIIDRGITFNANAADYFAVRGAILEGLDRKREALAAFNHANCIDRVLSDQTHPGVA